MKIALDYDNTFTADPELWLHFVNMARVRGHEVKIVTSRYPGNPPPAIGNIEIICCSFTAKRQHYKADIWIDDDPYHIGEDHDQAVLTAMRS